MKRLAKVRLVCDRCRGSGEMTSGYDYKRMSCCYCGGSGRQTGCGSFKEITDYLLGVIEIQQRIIDTL